MAATVGIILTWVAVLSLAVVLGIMLLWCGGVVVSECCGRTYFRGLAQLKLWPPSGSYEIVGEDDEEARVQRMEEVLRRWIGEASVVLTLLWLTCSGSLLLGSCGLPVLAVYGLVVPFLVRVKAWESYDVIKLEGAADSDQSHPWYALVKEELSALLHRKLRLDAVLGSLEVLDAVSDGATVASAWLLDARSTERFRTAWRATPLVGAAAAGLGPVGCMLVALGFATLCQLGTAGWSEGSVEQRAAQAAEVAGASGLAKRLTKDDAVDRGNVALALFLARVVAENAPQLLLQTSIIAAKGRGVLYDPVLVISIGLSCLTMLKKYCEQLPQVIDYVRTGSYGEAVGRVLFTAPIPCLLAYIATKLYFVERCPSHTWGMSTGCVEL